MCMIQYVHMLLMNYVQLPQSFVGYEDLYYESFALPTVSSKLSSLRGNFVTKCRNTFNKLYCSRLSDDVGKSFDTLLSIADDWDALQHNTSALSSFTILFIITLVTCMDALLSRVG